MRLSGRASAVFIVVALFCLADGLYSAISEGYDLITLIPDQTLMVSGPSPLKNPLDKDIAAQITPATDDVHFVFESFFPSYWFGSAMWRGAVRADAGAQPGTHELTIRFRGVSARNAQKFLIVVWKDEAAKQAGAASVVQRLTGAGPELPGLVFGLIGLLLGGLTFLCGRRYIKMLGGFGCSEVFRSTAADDCRRIFCFTNGLPAPAPESFCRIFSPEGQELGQAMLRNAVKGVLEFSVALDISASSGCLVELRKRK